MEQSATGTARHALQLPEDDPDDKSVNLILADEGYPSRTVMIGDLTRRERHADVYSVYDPETYAKSLILEARAFVIDGVSGKLKKYRKRCTYRLGARTWLSAPCRGAKVIVYKTNSSDTKAQEVNLNLSESYQSLPHQPKDTDYKREAVRTRQLEKRREKRQKRNNNQDLEIHSSSRCTEFAGHDEPEDSYDISYEDTFRRAILLYILYNGEGELRSAQKPDIPDADSLFPGLSYYPIYNRIINIQAYGIFSGKLKCLNRWRLTELEDHQEKLSELTYRQLFSGIHSKLSEKWASDALSSIKGKNHRSDIIHHTQSTLPILLEKAQKDV